jgi:hypothetical protein
MALSPEGRAMFAIRPGTVQAWEDWRMLAAAMVNRAHTFRRQAPLYEMTMKNEPNHRANETSTAQKKQREDRLKQALRENLKRRKSQSRGRSELTAAADGGTPSDDESIK